MKTAIVTGATRGIGRHTAIALARLGYDVAVTGRTRREGEGEAPGSLATVCAAIAAEGQRAVPIVLDLLDRSGIASAAEEAIATLGHIDVVLNNAIYTAPGLVRLVDSPADEIVDRIFVNVTAQLLFTQPILRHLEAQGSGVVAFTTSRAAYAEPQQPPGAGGWGLTYGVSKAGMHRIAEHLVIEHPRLRFYNLQPGRVATERIAGGGRNLAFVLRNAAPVGAIGEAFARILDSPDATFANGATIDVQSLARAWGLLDDPAPT